MSKETIVSIFVYGTLKQGCLRSGVWPRTPVSIRPALIRASLYDVGPYPAIGEGDDWVLGEVWTLLESDLPITLEVLDEVEGYAALGSDNEYLRVIVEAEFADGSKAIVFTYRFADLTRLTTLRRIEAHQEFAGKKCASWPDANARVPRTLAEE